jgi:hypothetical protein
MYKVLEKFWDDFFFLKNFSAFFFFFQFCDVALVVMIDISKAYLAKFGIIQNMKVKKVLSPLSHCMQLW